MALDALMAGLRMTFGERVRSRRKALRLSLEDIADRIGVTRSAVGHYEHNRTEPEHDRLKKLSEVLECTISWLVYGTEDGLIPSMNQISGWIERGGIVTFSEKSTSEQAPTLLCFNGLSNSYIMRGQVGPYSPGDIIYVARQSEINEERLMWGRPAIVDTGKIVTLARSVVPIRDGVCHVYLYEGELIPSVKIKSADLIAGVLLEPGVSIATGFFRR